MTDSYKGGALSDVIKKVYEDKDLAPFEIFHPGSTDLNYNWFRALLLLFY